MRVKFALYWGVAIVGGFGISYFYKSKEKVKDEPIAVVREPQKNGVIQKDTVKPVMYETRASKVSLAMRDFDHKSRNAYRSPVVATSLIIECYDHNVFKGIVLIERCNYPRGKSLPGGMVEYGENIEATANREMLEECGLQLQDIRQFHVYSSPGRDPRFHVVDVVQIARVSDLKPFASTDAKRAWISPLSEIPLNELVFDHRQIVEDYLKWRRGEMEKQLAVPVVKEEVSKSL